MGGSPSKSFNNFRRIISKNTRVSALESLESKIISLSDLQKELCDDVHSKYAGCINDTFTTLDVRVDQETSNKMEEQMNANSETISLVEEEVREVSLAEQVVPILLDEEREDPKSNPSITCSTVIEIPVHTDVCTTLTSTTPRNSPFLEPLISVTKRESQRTAEKPFMTNYSRSGSHSVGTPLEHVPPGSVTGMKSTETLKNKTLCQKYPHIYGKSRENLFPLITSASLYSQTNESTYAFRPESTNSLSTLSEWRTNRLAGGTYIHYPSRSLTHQTVYRSRLPQNPAANRLKPINKALIPFHPAAGDHRSSSSRVTNLLTSKLPPLLRPEVSRTKLTHNKLKNNREVELGALYGRVEVPCLPPPTSSSSPRVKGRDPFRNLKHGENNKNVEQLQRDCVIFRDSRGGGQSRNIRKLSIDEIYDSQNR